MAQCKECGKTESDGVKFRHKDGGRCNKCASQRRMRKHREQKERESYVSDEWELKHAEIGVLGCLECDRCSECESRHEENVVLKLLRPRVFH